jgi:hypothetical protein
MVEESVAWMRAEDVAAFLGWSRRRVAQIPASELPYVQLEVRGQRRYDPRDVARYLERRTVRS